MLTTDKLIRIAPNVGPSAGVFVQPLNHAMERFSIATPLEQAHFLAQTIHESQWLSRTRENLNYSAAGLVKTWPKRFPTHVEALAYANQPQKIANFVYANRMGNGDGKSNDGWIFRGAGFLQLTGRSNHKEAAQALGFKGDLEAFGDYLNTIPGACLSAAWFFWKSGALRYASQDNTDAVSDIINIGKRTEKVGDAIGYEKRLFLKCTAQKVL